MAVADVVQPDYRHLLLPQRLASLNDLPGEAAGEPLRAAVGASRLLWTSAVSHARSRVSFRELPGRCGAQGRYLSPGRPTRARSVRVGPSTCCRRHPWPPPSRRGAAPPGGRRADRRLASREPVPHRGACQWLPAEEPGELRRGPDLHLPGDAALRGSVPWTDRSGFTASRRSLTTSRSADREMVKR